MDDVLNSTSYSPAGNSSLTSVAISFPKTSKTLSATRDPSTEFIPLLAGLRVTDGIVNFILVVGLNGLG